MLLQYHTVISQISSEVMVLLIFQLHVDPPLPLVDLNQRTEHLQQKSLEIASLSSALPVPIELHLRRELVSRAQRKHAALPVPQSHQALAVSLVQGLYAISDLAIQNTADLLYAEIQSLADLLPAVTALVDHMVSADPHLASADIAYTHAASHHAHVFADLASLAVQFSVILVSMI